MAKGSAPRVVLIRENLWEVEPSGEGGVIGGMPLKGTMVLVLRSL